MQLVADQRAAGARSEQVVVLWLLLLVVVVVVVVLLLLLQVVVVVGVETGGYRWRLLAAVAGLELAARLRHRLQLDNRLLLLGLLAALGEAMDLLAGRGGCC